MKFLIVVALMSFSSIAAATKTKVECHNIVDSVDREYCHKKRMQALDISYKKDKATWKKKLTDSAKKKKISALRTKVTRFESQQKMLADEVTMVKAQLDELSKAKTVKIKKKKKDRRSDIEKALNIRL